MSRLEQRIAKLEEVSAPEESPDFLICFVATDGSPSTTCHFVDGVLLEVDDRPQVQPEHLEEARAPNQSSRCPEGLYTQSFKNTFGKE